MPDSQRYSLNLSLIYNLEDIVIFLACKVFKFFPFLSVPFTFKVKIWISYKAYNWAFYEINITYTVPSGTMDLNALKLFSKFWSIIKITSTKIPFFFFCTCWPFYPILRELYDFSCTLCLSAFYTLTFLRL